MQRKELALDELVEAFPFPANLVFAHPWQAAAENAADAYRAWCEAPLAERGDAYAAYRAAEEREAAAAEELRTAEEGCQ